MKVWGHILDALERHGRCASVSVVATQGSAPRDEGAAMVVTPDGYHGTIGGGALEWRAIAEAQAMLPKGAGSRRTSHALGPELGQCCGGRVDLLTEVFDRTSLDAVRQHTAELLAKTRQVFVFGAGHVGRALILALAPFNFEVLWIDPRRTAFPGAMPRNVTAISPGDPAAVLDAARPGSLVFIMTHSHALDLALTATALQNPAVAHTGLIGSATKRARFAKRLCEGGVTADRIDALICPIGIAAIRSKEPAAIALATAAQIVSLDEQRSLYSVIPAKAGTHGGQGTEQPPSEHADEWVPAFAGMTGGGDRSS